MGASQSRSEGDEKVFQSETPISFSQDVVNQLSDRLDTPETSPERQSSLDAIIRSRIHSELEHLKQEEEAVRQEIENALEKENLDRERSMVDESPEAAEDESVVGRIPSSTALMGDLEEIRSKVDKYQARRDLSEYPEVKAAGEAVISCYKANLTTPLECWQEVTKFKESVAQVEQKYFKTLQ
ncbi:MICOS complex subunit mic19 [Hypsizygus marmoreus]|uniref:MICOS complex subunit mic19 n=1 Tax=Hypsizygus marmoreus TaxID=39966 RepID=A0A369JH87_HYPMA|nr:MICOS complex subunit mic19 [Hypsizygus marmoreus]